jgi:hypothetical protein
MTKILVVCGGAGRGLLGQRDALGFAAEMQLDVRHELVPVQNDQLAWRLPVDAAVLTTKTLLDWMEHEWGKDVDRYKNDPQKTTPQSRHARILYQGYPGTVTNLDYGLGQAPAIGGGVIRMPANENMLRTATRQMIQRIAQLLGPANELDVWIVSSTSGGTGAGIRRFVARVIAEEMRAHIQNCVIKLHFVLYGARTYTSVNAHQTSLNTFIGVAQDAAFVDEEFDMPDPPIRFFYYLELPDVGSGERARKEREKLVEVTARAMFLDELRPVLEKIANNVPNKTVFVRVGFWGGELPREQLYYETLRQLRSKLEQLTEPGDTRFLEGFTCSFEPLPDLKKALEQLGSPELLLNLIGRGWKFPRRPGTFLGRQSQDDYVLECEKAVEAVLKSALSLTVDRLAGVFKPESVRAVEKGIAAAGEAAPGLPTRGEAEVEKLTRELAISKPGQNIDWTIRQDLITDAHRVMAWTRKLLDRPDGHPPLVEEQRLLARSCSDIFNQFGAGSRDKAVRLATELPKFLDASVRLQLLRDIEGRASSLLSELEGSYNAVKTKAAEQEQMMVKAGVVSQTTSLVLAADLEKRVMVTNPRPWIEILDRAVQSKKDEQFRLAVECGAIGLTMNGLARVVGVSGEDPTEIRTEVMSKAGGIIINKEKCEGIWWQADSSLWNRGETQFQFRIFPWLNPQDLAILRAESTEDIQLICTSMGAIGLRVLAVDMVNIGQKDMAAAAQNLLRDMKTHLNQELTNWPTDNAPVVAKKTTGVLHLAMAGVGGEPLDLTALERIGLEAGEQKPADEQKPTGEQKPLEKPIDKLGYLYELRKLIPQQAPA